MLSEVHSYWRKSAKPTRETESITKIKGKKLQHARHAILGARRGSVDTGRQAANFYDRPIFTSTRSVITKCLKFF